MGRPQDTRQGLLEEVASVLGLRERVGSQHMELTQDTWTPGGNRKGKETGHCRIYRGARKCGLCGFTELVQKRREIKLKQPQTCL